MTDDLARLLDALSIEKAVFCGHDWGGAIVWPMAQLHPSRVAGVIGVCTPHRPPPPAPPLTIIEKRFGPKHYFIQF
ncbi:alpha/beta fold hydrolase, partial [Klebsiella pneumoniae]|uniref:alpha/beta fold hydrolase n=1 Tax=Klebsiella pneumoniae TaxID=573 RepID=UPI003B98467C